MAETHEQKLARLTSQGRWADLARATLVPVLVEAGAVAMAREVAALEVRELGEDIAPPDPGPWHRLARMRGDPEHTLWCSLMALALEAGDATAVAAIETMVIRRIAS